MLLTASLTQATPTSQSPGLSLSVTSKMIPTITRFDGSDSAAKHTDTAALNISDPSSSTSGRNYVIVTVTQTVVVPPKPSSSRVLSTTNVPGSLTSPVASSTGPAFLAPYPPSNTTQPIGYSSKSLGVSLTSRPQPTTIVQPPPPPANITMGNGTLPQSTQAHHHVDLGVAAGLTIGFLFLIWLFSFVLRVYRAVRQSTPSERGDAAKRWFLGSDHWDVIALAFPFKLFKKRRGERQAARNDEEMRTQDSGATFEVPRNNSVPATVPFSTGEFVDVSLNSPPVAQDAGTTSRPGFGRRTQAPRSGPPPPPPLKLSRNNTLLPLELGFSTLHSNLYNLMLESRTPNITMINGTSVALPSASQGKDLSNATIISLVVTIIVLGYVVYYIGFPMFQILGKRSGTRKGAIRTFLLESPECSVIAVTWPARIWVSYQKQKRQKQEDAEMALPKVESGSSDDTLELFPSFGDRARAEHSPEVNRVSVESGIREQPRRSEDSGTTVDMDRSVRTLFDAVRRHSSSRQRRGPLRQVRVSRGASVRSFRAVSEHFEQHAGVLGTIESASEDSQGSEEVTSTNPEARKRAATVENVGESRALRRARCTI
ncbi:hypothetical protein BU16DRAFT_612504 [Lophium mytilinum]|uniref:Uncharacterized protein n=1 Tax=Lophium mytilinum TaxID=390894 RepID=A0A6A6RE14_9PEZI|nr:hypothetical protein BU16DRAFT_612504 [Lophium mytilinum]